MAALFNTPKAPEVKPTAPLPDELSPGVLEARRRRAAEIMGRGGRRSTLLQEGEGEAGATTFTDSKLGG
jgi:hypothetical protein